MTELASIMEHAYIKDIVNFICNSLQILFPNNSTLSACSGPFHYHTLPWSIKSFHKCFFFWLKKGDILNYLKSFHKCFNEEVTSTLTGETIIWSFFFFFLNMVYLLVLRSFLIRELKRWSKMKYCNEFTVRKKKQINEIH